ncbi:MAG TPA: DUF2851 family protein [Edaphocola sp.]|nr:DUF2851 family protein [Edaphocola sp.]
MMLNEEIFQFIWQFALFQSTNLRLKDGNSVQVLNRGNKNFNSGPDFLNAKIQIGQTIWAGNVELHLKSSDWIKHGHDSDPAYQNIILHVVYEDDLVQQSLGNFPVLELKPYISSNLFENYRSLMESIPKLACFRQVSKVPDIIKDLWLQRMLTEKWEQKFEIWSHILQKSQNNWSHLFYLVLAKAMGGKVNGEAMQTLAEHTPLKILAKHKDNLSHIESILLGQAGLIPLNPQDPYEIELKVHYAFFREKYKLEAIDARLWKFLRMRPANFPTLRIAQLARLVFEKEHLFSKVLQMEHPAAMFNEFNIGASEYWQHHYVFQKKSSKSIKNIGATLQQNIWINVVAPLQYFYGKEMANQKLQFSATNLLELCPPEKNSIIKTWNESGIFAKNAAETQALIHLYNNYCSSKKCLNCSIGHWILKDNSN